MDVRLLVLLPLLSSLKCLYLVSNEADHALRILMPPPLPQHLSLPHSVEPYSGNPDPVVPGTSTPSRLPYILIFIYKYIACTSQYAVANFRLKRGPQIGFYRLGRTLPNAESPIPVLLFITPLAQFIRDRI